MLFGFELFAFYKSLVLSILLALFLDYTPQFGNLVPYKDFAPWPKYVALETDISENKTRPLCRNKRIISIMIKHYLNYAEAAIKNYWSMPAFTNYGIENPKPALPMQCGVSVILRYPFGFSTRGQRKSA